MVAHDTEFQVGGVINFRTLDGALAIPIDLSVDRSVDFDTRPRDGRDRERGNEDSGTVRFRSCSSAKPEAIPSTS